MKKIPLVLSALALGLSGCASVPTVSEKESDAVKAFAEPKDGNAAIYVFRNDSPVGAALKKDVFINGKCVGETAPGVFFYQEVEGDKEHIVGTESEFSDNNVKVFAETGQMYFVQQFIKLGVFVGGAGLELVDEAEGKAEITKYDMAVQGNCSE